MVIWLSSVGTTNEMTETRIVGSVVVSSDLALVWSLSHAAKVGKCSAINLNEKRPRASERGSSQICLC